MLKLRFKFIFIGLAVFGVLSTILFYILLYSKGESAELQQLLKKAPDFDAKIFISQNLHLFHYRLLKPLQYNENQKYPMVVFLNGSAERGDDNIKQLKFAGPLFDNPPNRRKFNCFVVIPQCPARQNWVVHENYFGAIHQSPKPAKPSELTIELIRLLLQKYKIDERRIYIIGISSGASGVWDLTTRHPALFAAGMVFCGCGDPSKVFRIKKLPFWIFHGSLDLVVSPKCSRIMDSALKKAGGKPRYTEYPGEGHTCWIKAFQDRNLLKWLFAQKRPAASSHF